jgi:hypothetical protein
MVVPDFRNEGESAHDDQNTMRESWEHTHD